MNEPCCSARRLTFGFSFLFLFVVVAPAQLLNTDLEVRVSGVSSLMARTHEPADVLLTSLDTVLHDRSICCGRDSALEDSAAAADPSSLKDVAAKLNGRHLLGDGRPIQITAEYWPTADANSGMIIGALTDKHALLMLWDSHIYVVYGAVYRWTWMGSEEGGSAVTILRKLMLLDTRYSDYRRRVTFNRETDDLSKVQGLLLVTVSSQ